MIKRKTMIQSGEWLESFLNPNIQIHEYGALARQGLRNLSITFDLVEEDIIDLDIAIQYKKNVILPAFKKLFNSCLSWREILETTQEVGTLKPLYQYYGEIQEVYRNNAGELMKQVEFTNSSVSFWLPMISRFFFDFLENGGQKCFKFCEHCGRFTVTKRSDKKYCSAVCRAASQQGARG